jgi:hypothetical protein
MNNINPKIERDKATQFCCFGVAPGAEAVLLPEREKLPGSFDNFTAK